MWIASYLRQYLTSSRDVVWAFAGLTLMFMSILLCRFHTFDQLYMVFVVYCSISQLYHMTFYDFTYYVLGIRWVDIDLYVDTVCKIYTFDQLQMLLRCFTFPSLNLRYITFHDSTCTRSCPIGVYCTSILSLPQQMQFHTSPLEGADVEDSCHGLQGLRERERGRERRKNGAFVQVYFKGDMLSWD